MKRRTINKKTFGYVICFASDNNSNVKTVKNRQKKEKFMNLKLKKRLLFTLVVVFALIFSLGLAVAFPQSGRYAFAETTSTEMTIESVSANSNSKYNSNEYKNSFKVNANEIASYTANGGEREGYELSKAFDTVAKTYWVSQEGNTDSFKNHVVVSFNKALKFQALTFSSAYYSSGNERKFSGYPTHLKVYAATGNGEFVLVGECQSQPRKDFSEVVAFSLASAVQCDKIKLEFVEVSIHSAVFDGVAVVSTMDISLFKSDEALTAITAQRAQLEADFVSVYKVPTSLMTYEANCDAASGTSLANAFDGNWGSGWSAAKDNGNGHASAITVHFSRAVTIDSILYASSNNRDGYGYPTKLKIYIANGGDLELYGECNSAGTSSRMQFLFKKPQTVTDLKFEFAVVNTAHKWQATAQEIQFLQPANESINSTLNLFSDYTQHTVRSEYASAEKLNKLRNDVKDAISYESALKPLIDRAEACLNGYIAKDAHREFQTDPNARNPINQYGDMAGYARNELLLNSIGTNRQVIGIGGTTGKEIVVYVEAEDGDPLPQIAFTQIYGAWNSWWSTATLKRGKNVFTFPNFVYSDKYSVPINAGGPIHIINPYTPEQQSHNVKLYIEGGYVYPVFHDGDDETTFKMILEDYYQKLKDPANTEITIDAFEAVSDSIILSCRASNAYDGYINKGWSPQLNIDRWNEYVRKLLSFGGVDCVEGGEYFTEKNKHITINYRAVQPYAGMYAFAAGEHIGIPDAGTHVAMVLKGTPGWAFAHEFGHTVDLRGRIWGEVTNNMWAMYDRMYIEGNFDNRIGLNQMMPSLASDLSDKVDNYWPNGNCSFWFVLEAGCPGYWAGSENAYRYEAKTHSEDAALIKQLGNTERMLYFGSLGAKDDLRDYFERWGFYMNGDGVFNANNRWAKSKQTEALKTLMEKAKAAGRIQGDGKKYWYLDESQCRAIKQHGEKLGDWASCYDSSDIVKITSVMNVGNTYTLLLPTPKNQEAHLGYEIQSLINGEWKVVGFTYYSSFTDTITDGRVPTYRVVAYDRMLNHSGVSEEKAAQVENVTNVCKIGDTYYNTLKEAVAAAQTGDIIILLKSCYAGGISFSHKKVVICPSNDATEDLVITKSSSGPMFYLNTDAYKWDTALQIGNNSGNGAKIVLDGNNFYQSGALIHSGWSDVTLNNVLLRNNQNSGNGGAIYVGLETTLKLNKAVIENNSAANGGGIYEEGRCRVHMNGATIRNNTASGSGGGVYVTEAYGGSTFTNTNNRNSANFITGNTANYGGGIYTENGVNLFNVEISENTAKVQGGGIYANISYGRGNIGMTTCKMQNNASPMGSTFYMNRGKVYLNGGVYNGNFYKVLSGSDKPEFYLNASFPDFSNAEFEVPVIAKDGTALLDGITNLTVTSEQAQTIKIKNGHPVLITDENKVVAQSNIVTVKINYNGGSYDFECPMGKWTLPECIPEFDESKYFTGWEIGGKAYKTGDQIELTANITVQATIQNYFKVTVDYGSSKEIKYFKANDVYYMPMKTPEDNKEIWGFNGSDGKHYVYADGAVITGDVTFTAVLKKLLNLTMVVNGENIVNGYEFNSVAVLTAPQGEVGEYFKHWLIDGKEYAANSQIRLTSNVTAMAVFTDAFIVTVQIEGEQQEVQYLPNTLIKLSTPKEIENKVFKHWLIEGVEYLAGADYTVTKDVTMQAVYEDAPEKPTAKATVTLVYTKDGQQVTENKKVNVNSEFVLPKPTVDEGKVFLYWLINNVRYNAGSSVAVTQDLTITAEIVDESDLGNVSLEIVVKNVTSDGKTEISKYLLATKKIGEIIQLTQPTQAPKGYKFEYYLVNGEQKKAGDNVEVTVDTEIKAVYSSTSQTPEPTPPVKDPADNQNTILIVALVGVVVVIAGLAVLLVFAAKKKRK